MTGSCHRELDKAVFYVHRMLQPFPRWENIVFQPPRKAIISFAAQRSSSRLLAHAAPLLEKERNTGCLAMLPDRKNPVLFHRPSAGAALTPDDDP